LPRLLYTHHGRGTGANQVRQTRPQRSVLAITSFPPDE